MPAHGRRRLRARAVDPPARPPDAHAALGSIVASARATYGENLVALAVFGSFARGTATAASDLDLLVVLRRRPGGRLACLESFRPVEAATDLDVSPVFRTPEDLAAGFPLMLEMAEDAKILYDPSAVLTDALGRLRRRLRELGARRVPYKGAWYWDLKPDFRPGEVVEL